MTTVTISNRHSSPIVRVFEQLRALNASWDVQMGRPRSAEGWIIGEQLADASAGPLNELLRRIGSQLRTTDRRTIAALYAMRFGWASAIAIAPFAKFNCVPHIGLGNVSLKFKESTFFERSAIHEPRGTFVRGSRGVDHPSVTCVASRGALLRSLRDELTHQAAPVVEALYSWSGFARRGTWGMLTSSWTAHFTSLAASRPDQSDVLPLLNEFFEGTDLAADMRPRLHIVHYRNRAHVYQRRASCCRFYLVPQGELCASCPLVSDEERVARNLAWMKKQIDEPSGRRSHS
jgi:hypothetical protein